MLAHHPASDSRIATVMERWQHFRYQLELRFSEILAEAVEACDTLLIQDEDDPNAMRTAWIGAHSRAADLATCLADAWNDQFVPRLHTLGAPAEVVANARAELAAVHDRMELELEQTRVRIFAEAARIRWVRALRDAPSQLACSCCGARQPIPATFGPAQTSCSHCGMRLDYEPGARVRALAEPCVHALCEEAAWEAWLEMRRAEQQLHYAPVETIELLKGFERAQIVYWHTYLQMRITLLPHTACSFTEDLRRCMQAWYQQVDDRTAWARAGRPRTLA